MFSLIQEFDTTPDAGLGLPVKSASPNRLFWRRFRKNKAAMIGLVLLMVLVVLCLAAPLLSKQDPIKQSLVNSLVSPSAKHPFGTDYLGRDILIRLLYGGRLTLTISLLAVTLGIAIGVPLGAASGYFGGWVDLLIQRAADILLSFPSFLLALTLVALMGIGVRNMVISVGIMAIPSFIRIIRGSVLSVREMPYIEAARSLGSSHVSIIVRHVLPNVVAPMIVNASLNMGYAISTAAGLGFLGLGVQPPTPEWGMMLGEGKNYIFSHPYMVTFPGLTIFVAIVALNLLGDGLRDAMDPR